MTDAALIAALNAKVSANNKRIRDYYEGFSAKLREELSNPDLDDNSRRQKETKLGEVEATIATLPKLS